MEKSKSMIKVGKEEGITTIRLSRIDKRNALNIEMFEQLKSTFEELQGDEETEVIILTGIDTETIKVFSSGIDLKELANIVGNTPEEELEDIFIDLQDSVSIVANTDKPVIALIKGPCIGSGFELALACDFRIASENAQVGLFETRFGIIPDLGGTTRLINTVGQQVAKRVIMFTEEFNGEEAKDLGLVDWVYPEEEIDNEVIRLAKILQNNSGKALESAMSIIPKIADRSIEEGLDIERKTQLELLESGDIRSRIRSYL